jgi:hypothetical protein
MHAPALDQLDEGITDTLVSEILAARVCTMGTVSRTRSLTDGVLIQPITTEAMGIAVDLSGR